LSYGRKAETHGFESLVKDYSGDTTARVILVELLHVWHLSYLEQIPYTVTHKLSLATTLQLFRAMPDASPMALRISTGLRYE